MVQVRYATGWRFDILQSAIRIGALRVPVSSPKVERFGSWWLRRIDESTWAIAAHKFGTGRMAPSPIYEAWGFASVILLGAPPDVSLELELV